MEDVKEVINFLFEEVNIKNYRIDKKNVFLVGHSMGGFLALTHCTDERIKASVAISTYDFGLKGCLMKEDKEELKEGINMFLSDVLPLNVDNHMYLIKEAIEKGEDWNLIKKAKYLSKENLLITGGTKDIVGPMKVHYIPLVKEIYKHSNNNLKAITTDTDHLYSNKRIWLSKVVAEYIEDIYYNN